MKVRDNSQTAGRCCAAGQNRKPRKRPRTFPATPLVAGIKRFSLDDGPGIRTTVFLKGCALACRWCHNPEFRDALPQIDFRADRCIGCHACSIACGEAGGGNEDGCNGCGRCVRACPAGALRLTGESMDPERLATLLLEDHLFYTTSGGGVTFSGGEPALYGGFCADTARLLKKHAVNIALQTAGMFSWRKFSATLLPFLDQIYFDFKTANAADHVWHTGAVATEVRANFRRLAATGIPLIATMVLVPGVNDTGTSVGELREFAASCGVTRFETRFFHDGGNGKQWMKIGKPRRDYVPPGTCRPFFQTTGT